MVRTRTNKRYSREFKIEAIRQAKNSGKPIAQIARELDIPVKYFYRWSDEIHRKAEKAFSGSENKLSHPQSNLSTQELTLVETIEELRRENKKLKEDHEILKKSLAYFVEQSLKDMSLSAKTKRGTT